MRTKPEFFNDVLAAYVAFADEFGVLNPSEDVILVTADHRRQIIRGIGVFESAIEAAAVRSSDVFEAFRARVADMLSEVPEREEQQLVHMFIKA